ncbi:MAG TPA: hypothetical protein VKZ66_00440 [Pusillimonas sp.]|uniref:hypothetical protein n=1 Tax=Pusillimonas sp. TaxID=3040095 RepID=UPI002B4B428E|nr:hypothetical protein [Pusillimonas sp.]HLU18400.1 hypothetical protein [Pusillimonas sp.]
MLLGIVTFFTGPRWLCLQAWAVSVASTITAEGHGLGGWTVPVMPVQWLINLGIALVVIWALYLATIRPLERAFRRADERQNAPRTASARRTDVF